MRSFVLWLAGWSLSFLPAAAAALLITLGDSPTSATAHPVAVAGWSSACTFGVFGSLVGAATGGNPDDASAIRWAALIGGLFPGIFSFMAVLVAFATPEPGLWLAGALGFILPGAVGGAATAWLFRAATRGTHGTS